MNLHIYGYSYIIAGVINPRGLVTTMMSPAQFFKCLSDETRLRCLLLIQREGELCVCELTAALQEIQPKISRHLAQLKKCALLLDRRQGQWVFYRINPKLPDWALQVIAQTHDANTGWIKPDVRQLEKMGDRPARAQACC